MAHELKKIGVLGVEGDNPVTSHIYAQWAPLLNPRGDFTRRTGMIITHVWDKDRPIAEKFARQYDVPHVVDDYDGMVGEVDGVIQSGLRGSPWGPDLVRPYLEGGTAVFMDRPGAYSLARARELAGMSDEHGTPLMVTNNHESGRIVETMTKRARSLGSLTGLIADSLTDRKVKWFAWHCIHGWYMIYPILTGKVRTVRTYMVNEEFMAPLTVMECRNDDGSPFLATLARQRPVHRGWVKIFGRDQEFEATMLPPLTYRTGDSPLSRSELARDTEERREYLLTEFSLPPMRAFERMIRTGKMPQTPEQIVDKIQVFLAMFQSLLEGGRPIELAKTDPNWTAPYPFEGYFPDGYFRRRN